MADTEQPQWAALIEKRRKEMRPTLSARKAAERAGLSEGRWRQIVKGYQSTSGGRVPVVGPAETVARMARVVGLAADELEQAGRPDAADELRRAESGYGVPMSPEMIDENLDVQAMWAELKAYMNSGEEWPERPPTQALMLWSTEQLLEVLVGRVRGLLEDQRRSTRQIVVRGQAIDSLRRELGLEPRHSHLAHSKFATPQALQSVGGVVAAQGGDGDADADAGGSAPTRADFELIAHDEEHTIESEQGFDETP